MTPQQDLTLNDYISILRRRWLLIAVLATAGGIMGLVAAHAVPKRFTSQSVIAASQPAVSGNYVPQEQDLGQTSAVMLQQLLSREGLAPIIKKFGLFGDESNTMPLDVLVARVQKAVTIGPILPTDSKYQGLAGFTVSAVYSNPLIAQQMCSAISTELVDKNSQNHLQLAQQTTQFLDGQIADAKAKLDEQDANLAAFERRYLGALPGQDQTTDLNLLSGLTSQLDATTQALSRAQQDKSFAESMLAQQLTTLKTTPDAAVPGPYAAQIAALETQLSALKANYTDSHPDVIKVQKDIDALKKMAAQQQNSKVNDKGETSASEPAQVQSLRVQLRQDEDSIKELTARQTEIQAKIKVYEDRVQSSPAVEQEYKKLTRDYQTATDFYNNLLKNRDQSALANNLVQQQQGEQFQILVPATLPSRPSFPNKLYFGAGGLGGGLMLGLGISLMLEMQDTSIHTDKQLETLLHIPVLASIPTLKSGPRRLPKEPPLDLVVRA